MKTGLSILLDTHVFVWALTDAPELKASTRKIIEGATKRFVSAASYWEIATKSRIGKWPNVEACLLARDKLERFGFSPLRLDLESAARAGNFDWEHSDPFDRILVAQAERKNIPLVSYDQALMRQMWVRVIQ